MVALQKTKKALWDYLRVFFFVYGFPSLAGSAQSMCRPDSSRNGRNHRHWKEPLSIFVMCFCIYAKELAHLICPFFCPSYVVPSSVCPFFSTTGPIRIKCGRSVPITPWPCIFYILISFPRMIPSYCFYLPVPTVMFSTFAFLFFAYQVLVFCRHVLNRTPQGVRRHLFATARYGTSTNRTLSGRKN